MDWSLLLNYGVGPAVVVILILAKILVPGWILKKAEDTIEVQKQRIDLLGEVNAELTAQVAGFNQVIGALRAESQYRRIQAGEEIGEINGPRRGSL